MLNAVRTSVQQHRRGTVHECSSRRAHIVVGFTFYGVGDWAARHAPVARSGRIERALRQLVALKENLCSPRTRYRQEAKVAAAVAAILDECGATDWIVTEVQPRVEETFHEDHRGRPGKAARYVRKAATRFDLVCRIDDALVAEDAAAADVFPLVTNVAEFSALELLHAYERQPAIEKRFPIYPEGRPCRWPTARRVIDRFESVQRYTLEHRQRPREVLLTELTRLQRRLLKLPGLPANDYGRQLATPSRFTENESQMCGMCGKT